MPRRWTSRRGFLLILLGAALLVALTGCRAKSVQVLRRSGEFFIAPNGQVQVVETWEVRFRGGPFHRASRTIPFNRLDGVTDWQIAEGGQPYRQVENSAQAAPGTFWVEETATQSRVVWVFPETTNATRTFTLRYTLQGALRLATAGDRFFYTFIEADRSYPIEEAQAIVHLPAAFPRAALETATFRNAEPSHDEVTFPDASTVVFRTRGLAAGDAWEVGVAWPHGAVHAAPPAWQQAEMQRILPLAYQAALQLEDGGALHVRETWRLRFVAGPFTNFTRQFPQKAWDSITDWRLSMDGAACPRAAYPSGSGCTLVVLAGSDDAQPTSGYRAVWYFPETTDATHTFTLEYTVWGAVATGRQARLRWNLADFTRLAPPQTVEVSLTLPAAIAAEAQPTLWMGDARWEIPPQHEARTWRFAWPPGPAPANGTLRLEAAWPGERLSVARPAWQQAQDAEQAAFLRRLARLGLLTAPGVLLVLALLGFLWLLEPPLWPWPRPKPRPPEDLPPALAGVLLDREVRPRHFVATLWDLARRGYLRFEPAADDPAGQNARWYRGREPDAALRTYEQAVLAALFPAADMTSASQAVAQTRLAQQWPGLLEALTIEVQRQGWFRWPWRSRVYLRRALWGLTGVWAFVFVGGCFLIEPPSGKEAIVYGLWPLLLGLMATLAIVLPRRMPPRTWAGWRAARRWLAYRMALRWHKSALGKDASSPAEALAYATAFGLGPRLLRRWQHHPPRAAAAQPFEWVRPSTVEAQFSGASASRGASRPRLDLNATAAATFATLNAAGAALLAALDAAAGQGPAAQTGRARGWTPSRSGFDSTTTSGSTFTSGESSGGGSSEFE